MRRSRIALAVAALAVLAGACGGEDAAASGSIRVAAASDLRIAFEELGEAFTAETGVEVVFSFGSSGQLREQIVNGAPFDLFASADVAYVDDVVDAGRGDAGTVADYALGRLALVAASGHPLPAAVEDLADPEHRRVAIANPEHAPYGVAAEDALASAGVLDAVRDRLVLGENISDTLRIVESGNADVGIVALSLVAASDTPHTPVLAEQHAPLRQALVVLGEGERADDARAFAELVTGPEGRSVLVAHGFDLPTEGR